MSAPLTTRLSFAASGTASGLVSNGVSYFLLIFYAQVLGLDAALAGLALMLSLIVDAVSDPLVGRWSDRLRHRLGRRHPFLYAAIVPVAVSYYLLWSPPASSQGGLFASLLILTVTLRLSLTLHVVPFNALLPELASNYDERTRLLNYSYSGAWFFGTAMAVAMYAVWLADTPEYPDGSGILRAEGYADAAFWAGIAILGCLAYAAFATRRYVPDLLQGPPPDASAAGAVRETRETLSDRNLLAMIASGILTAAASGASTALWAYMQPYFWGFDSEQISLLLMAQLLSPLLAFALQPTLTRRRDKRPVLVGLSLASLLVGSAPVMLSLLGLFPPSGHGALFPTMLIVGVVQVSLIVLISVVSGSMIADIVEARELRTGRREEGLLFATLSFTGKVASGLGIWIGGTLLTLIDFPTEATTFEVTTDTISRLGWLYGPTLGALYLLAVVPLAFYRLDRATHEANLRALDKRANVTLRAS